MGHRARQTGRKRERSKWVYRTMNVLAHAVCICVWKAPNQTPKRDNNNINKYFCAPPPLCLCVYVGDFVKKLHIITIRENFVAIFFSSPTLCYCHFRLFVRRQQHRFFCTRTNKIKKIWKEKKWFLRHDRLWQCERAHRARLSRSRSYLFIYWFAAVHSMREHLSFVRHLPLWPRSQVPKSTDRGDQQPSPRFSPAIHRLRSPVNVRQTS